MNILAHKDEMSFYITTTIVKDKVPADGKSVCTIKVNVSDGGFNPVAGEPIRVLLTGGGLTAGNELPGGTFFTNGHGTVVLDIIKKQEGEVTAQIVLVRDMSITAVETVEFIQDGGEFKIRAVINRNRAFSTIGEPTIAWNGATFEISVQGGSESRDNIWRVIKSAAEVSVDGNANGDGVVTIKNNTREDCIIQCTDPKTKQTLEYRFNIRTLVAGTTQYLTPGTAFENYRDNLLRPDECENLFKQWGNLLNYAKWNIDDLYWTRSLGALSGTAYDFKIGLAKELPNFLTKKPAVYRIGS